MAKYKKIIIEDATPLLNFVYVTAERVSAEESAALNGGIVAASQINQLKDLQIVKAISPAIQNPGFKVGDLVEINITSYGKPVQKKSYGRDNQSVNELDETYNAQIAYSVPVVEIDGVEYLKLRYSEIDAIIMKYREEKVEEKKIPVFDVGRDPQIIVSPDPNIFH